MKRYYFLMSILLMLSCHSNKVDSNNLSDDKNKAIIQDVLTKNNATEIDSIDIDNLFIYQIQSKLTIGNKIGFTYNHYPLSQDIVLMDSCYLFTWYPGLNGRIIVTIKLQQKDIDDLETSAYGYMIIEIMKYEFIDAISTQSDEDGHYSFMEKRLFIMANKVAYVALKENLKENR